MKTNLIPIMISIILTCTINVYPQINWTKYANNPVFSKGPAFYDVMAVGQPTVLIENDTIKMWYSAVGGDMKSRIGYAYSIDGVNWTKYSDMVINTGYQGEWDSKWLDTPEIIKVDSGYLLYYYGDSIGYDTNYIHYEAVTHSAIGFAFSTDGINWTKYTNNPVFLKGNYGEWDWTWIESPAILFNNSTGELQMWYNGIDTLTWKVQIGLATSSDGIHWTKYLNNPVLTYGNTGTYDDAWLGTPAVIYKTDHYEMWYSSASSQDYNSVTYKFDTLRICFATSSDGTNWTKYPNNPLFNTGTMPYDSLIDTGGPWAPDVIFDTDSNLYKMWFETASGFLLATSQNTYVYIGYNNGNNYSANDLNIYPNPSKNFTTIEFSNPKYEKYTINIYNDMGQIVKSIKNIHKEKFKINTQNLNTGIYYFEIRNEKQIITTKKILIK